MPPLRKVPAETKQIDIFVRDRDEVSDFDRLLAEILADDEEE